MKNLLLLLLGFSFTTNTVNAQYFTLLNKTLKSCTNISNDNQKACSDNYIEMLNGVKNISNDSITFKWQLISSETQMPSDWSFLAFCDNSNCYFAGGDKNSNTWDHGVEMTGRKIAPGAVGDLKPQICVKKIEGTLSFKIKITVNDQVDTAEFILSKPCQGNNINDLHAPQMVIYPNPAYGDKITLVADQSYKAEKVEIFNLLGQKVFSTPLLGNVDKQDILTNCLTEGMYIINVVNQQGGLIFQKKWLKL